ncbi:jmjN domain, partial [Rhizoctonia solani]
MHNAGPTRPLPPDYSHLADIFETRQMHSPPSSRESTPELTPEQERGRRRAIVQPAFFYPNSGCDDPSLDTHQPLSDEELAKLDDEAFADALLDPAEDPRASRGIPVFRPTLHEFSDFERYMESIEPWGRRSGIVKVIPPKEWQVHHPRDGLSSTTERLSAIKLKNPIEQHFIGRTGLYRQQNEERRHTYSVRDWASACLRDGLRAPAPRDIVQQELNTRRSKRARKGEDSVEDEQERAALVDALRTIDERKPTPSRTRSATIHAPEPDFYNTLDPFTEWLPDNTVPEDYTPAVCRALERHFWRNCGLGKDPMYGADMQGTLFDPEMNTWNVAHLPNLLERVMPHGEKIPGVNTPYLYFGMWRATFAWHVEDMDLYSINYIHWGAPKYWYAIPSQRADIFEATMRKHFSAEAAECSQFMRHKSFLASPAILAEADCRPNTLVQHQGEFVITYPRGYHAGFNVGFNCAESVNFALESWIQLGRRAQYCKCVGDSVRFDVDAIISEYEARKNPTPLPPFNYDPSLKRKSHPADDPFPKRIRIREPDPPFATAAQLEQLPTIKIKIRPPATLPNSSRSPYRARTQPVSTNLPKRVAPSIPSSERNNRSLPPPSPTRRTTSPSRSSTSSLPKLRLPAQTSFPCYLCASEDIEGLLPVHESSREGASPTRRGMNAGQKAEDLRIHQACAEAVPETWIAFIEGQKYVCGVENIVKDRWTLKCSLCTKVSSKLHGAKIQCGKGRCSKAFHVSCARDSPDVEYTIGSADETKQPGEGLELKEPAVTVLCPQHNPRLVEARKADKQQKLDADIGSLKQWARIKVRGSGGVFAVTLVNVYEERRTVEVMWDQGSTKEFKYTSVVWTDDGEVQEKPGKVEGETLGSGEPCLLIIIVWSRDLKLQYTIDLTGSYPSPPPTQRDTNSPNAAPSALKPSPSADQSAKSARSTPNPTSSQSTRYSFQPYQFYPYPPPYPLGPSPPPSQSYQPPQPHPGFTVPLPVPMQYPYPYPPYGTQHGYHAHPHFFAAHGYQYAPMPTYHPPASLHSVNRPHSTGASVTGSPAPDSVTLAKESSINSTSAEAPRPPIQSYVGVRPASSQDILNSARQGRATTGA